MNEKDLHRALRVFLAYKNERKKTYNPRCKSFKYTKMNEKDLHRALRVFLAYKNERKRLTIRVASLFSIQK
jgi:hypothetical protein